MEHHVLIVEGRDEQTAVDNAKTIATRSGPELSTPYYKAQVRDGDGAVGLLDGNGQSVAEDALGVTISNRVAVLEDIQRTLEMESPENVVEEQAISTELSVLSSTWGGPNVLIDAVSGVQPVTSHDRLEELTAEDDYWVVSLTAEV